MGWGVHRHQAPVSWFPEFSPLQSLLKTWNTPLMTHPLTSDLSGSYQLGGKFYRLQGPKQRLDGWMYKTRRLYMG